MRVLLHDGYRNQGLSMEPISMAALAALLEAWKKADKYVKAKFGNWAGLNGSLLGIIGKHPATDPAAIESTRQEFLSKTTHPHYNTNVGQWIRATLNKSISNEDLKTFASNLEGGITQAKTGADKGDWAAARYAVVYTGFLKAAKDELATRISAYSSIGKKALPTSDAQAAGAPVPEYAASTGIDFKKIAIPAAIILALKFL